jgi:hypothetical protein
LNIFEYSKERIEYEQIKGSESPSEHCFTAYENYIKKSKAKKMVIVAHSAGGGCTVSLLCEKEEIYDRLKAIGFTDSGKRYFKNSSFHRRKISSKS